MNLVKFFKNRKYQKEYDRAIEKLDGYNLLQIGESAFNYYTKTVKGRKDCDYEEATKVLTRNVILSINTMKLVVEVKRVCYMFTYGNLSLEINEWKNKIISVKNSFGYNSNFKIDMGYKKWLNQKLGIIDLKDLQKENTKMLRYMVENKLRNL